MTELGHGAELEAVGRLGGAAIFQMGYYGFI